jgi:hypothetical protein
MGAAFMAPIFGAVASTVISGLMNKSKSEPVAAPTVTPPTAMPDPMAQKQVQRRKAATLMGEQLSAADTVLTGQDKLGA